ncbi:uncharacterized protein LOC131652043 [Vicia villosa]|uniref:uncharacterized protein LOC131652043 n=1 Tax=Vicia villosa TaxID=3911 RepID=UPI00273AB189|nr:uncharacterized protein LOC131652043 [Vicia villosa]
MPADVNMDTNPHDTTGSSRLEKVRGEGRLAKISSLVLEEVRTSTEKGVEKPSAGKESSAIHHTSEPRKSKNPAAEAVVNLDDLSDNDLIPIMMLGIAERLKTRKGKVVATSTPTKTKTRYGPSKPWSKEVPNSNKRKIRDSATSESDAEEDVQNILTNLKIKTSQFTDSVNQWKYVYQRRIALKRELGKEALECPKIMDLITHASLIKTVTRLGKCYDGLVKEFIVNIPVDCADHRSKELRKVYVRGRCVEFSPAVINRYLDRREDEQCEWEVTDNEVCKALTANQVNTWPMKDKLPASKLSFKYAILHRIGAANWVPTNNSSVISVSFGKFIYVVGSKKAFDYGAYIFEQTMKHVGTCAVKMPIAFPTLICGIIISQHRGILPGTDVIAKRESTLSLHFKLFTGKHVPNIAMTSTSTDPKITTKAEIISDLVEAFKELDEVIRVSSARKAKFEKMIKDLKKDDSADEEVGSKGGRSVDEEDNSEATESAGLEDS